jgi:hypothetical protein
MRGGSRDAKWRALRRSLRSPATARVILQRPAVSTNRKASAIRREDNLAPSEGPGQTGNLPIVESQSFRLTTGGRHKVDVVYQKVWAVE